MAVLSGFGMLGQYSYSPGEFGEAQDQWPVASELRRNKNRATLVMFLAIGTGLFMYYKLNPGFALPERLDLKDEHVRQAKKIGCRFSIDSDAHNPKHFEMLKFGIGQARRGWLEKKDVVNTLPVEKFLKTLK